MKFAVCIPVYHQEIEKLIAELQFQKSEIDEEIEIVVIDDASEFSIQEKNAKLQGIKYIQLAENVGRGAIHNLFLEKSSADYLLFLDCDVELPKGFLKKYLQSLNQNPNCKVFYGGFLDKGKNPESLRNRYSRAREIQPVSWRNQHPHKSFKTVNFLIHRDVFSENTFHPELSNYGYVDFVFAQQLKEKHIDILHIDNPVSHVDFSTNEDYILKIESATEKLYFLYQNEKYKHFAQETKLVNYFEKLKKFGFDKWFYAYFKKNKNKIQQRLVSEKTSLFWLDIYKLGCFLELEKSL